MNPSRRGFTLLELLVAAALAAVVASAVAVLFGRGLAAWQQANGRLERLFGIQKGLNRLGEELRNSVFLESADPPFTGEKNRIQFYLAQAPDRLVKVTYALSREKGTSAWIREQQKYPSSSEEAEPSKRIVMPVSDFSLQYGYLKQEEGAPTLRWEESWDVSQQKQLPRLVQVRVETKDRRLGIRTVRRVWWIPQGVLGSTPGE